MLNFRNLRKILRQGNRNKSPDIDPEDIFLDSRNLPDFDIHQMEGRLEKPISGRSIALFGIIFLIVGLVFASKLWALQIKEGEMHLTRSENNRLKQIPLFSNRGVVMDRNSEELAYNRVNDEESEFAKREYVSDKGLSHILGYLKYPSKDSFGFYYSEKFEGMAGVEKIFDDTLSGENGIKLIETDALDVVQSESVTTPPQDGEDIVLSIDSRVQKELYRIIENTANDFGFEGGAGVIMDVHTGELISLVSFPEYDSDVLTNRTEPELIQNYLTDEKKPFLNRAISGLYTPGSIVKPFVAAGVLEEDLIDPKKQILGTKSISIPNPYFPDRPSVFTDWKEHGLVDMRRAIAVSSNIYFYYVGGGYGDQKGLGISKIEEYLKKFGFGQPTGIAFSEERSGVIPNPEWKEENFDGDAWRIGDTYNTSIGQYGLLVTPIQAVRAVSAIANGGVLLEPVILSSKGSPKNPQKINIKEENLEIVREGMRQAVTEGNVTGLNRSFVEVAAKTGTAELGSTKRFVNSWVVGFFPYDDPQYAFTILMERGARDNQIGGVYVMSQLLDWMRINAPEYLE